MKNVKYVYNEHTLQYEEHKQTRKEKFRKSLYFSSAVVSTAVLMFVMAYQYFPTPKEKVMQKEKEQLVLTELHVKEKVLLLPVQRKLRKK